VVALPRGNRRGVSSLGCLVSALVAAVILYYGIGIGQVYWKYYRLTDEMATSARFAHSSPDPDIVRHLQGIARDLELPTEAQRFTIRRTTSPPLVTIRTQYHATIELPFHNRTLLLKPHVEVRQ
jgi:hypothetical protein